MKWKALLLGDGILYKGPGYSLSASLPRTDAGTGTEPRVVLSPMVQG